MGIRLAFRMPFSRPRVLREPYQILVLLFYALSTASPSSRDVIKMAGESSLSLGEISRIFKAASLAVEKWNYGLHEAIKHASKRLKDKLVKGFLGRLSDTLTLDINLSSFARIEFERMLAELAEDFERRLEKVKKLVDGYSAFLTSTTFLSVSMLLISTIYGMSVENVLISTSMGVLAVLAAMVYLIAVSLPPDPLLHDSPRAPHGQKILKRLLLILSPLLISASILILISGAGGEILDPFSLSALIPGIPLLMLGWMGLRWVKAAQRVDERLPSFMKDLGDAAEVSGSLKAACKLIMANDYGALNKPLRKLRRRLELGFDQNKALKVFGEECSSTMASVTSRIMTDALDHGSRASETGKAIHDYLLRRLENRRKRMQVAGMFWGVVLPLQGSFAAITALITALMKTLYQLMSLIQSWFPLISAIPATTIRIFFYAVGFGMAAASALAYYRLRGDSVFAFTYGLGALLTVTGAAHLLAYQASKKLIEMTASLTESITRVVGEL